MNAPIVSRGLNGLLAAVLAGGLSVAFLVTALTHAETPMIFLAYFAALPLYLAGLGAGVLAGLVAPVTATGLLLVLEPVNITFLYVFAYAVPAIGLSLLALRNRVGTDGKVSWFPEGKLLTAITIYPCILFLAAVGLASTHQGGLLDLTQQAFVKVGDHFAKQFDDADKIDLFRKAMEQAAQIAPALVAYTWILVAIISLAGAQYVLRQQKWNLRAHFSLQALHVPAFLIYAVAATGLMGVFTAAPYDYVGRNLSMVLGIPFFFVGLAVIHAWAGGTRFAVFFLLVFYVLLTLLPWLALLVAAIGVLDQWINFRQRITPYTPPSI